MSNRKLVKAVQRLFKQIWKLYRSLTKAFVIWLLRSVFLMGRRRSHTLAAGFVLPTTVFLILVVTLTTGALSYRAFSNSSRVIGNVQSKAIYNAATPAIDRARAKLDFLFGRDPRLPGGVPGEEFVISMMLNNEVGIGPDATKAPRLTGAFPGATLDDPYTLTGEQRVDINGGGVDNAWIYTDSATGNLIIYSINMSTPDGALGPYELLNLSESQKANGGTTGGPYVRTGPLSNSEAVNCPSNGGGIEKGWYEDKISTAILRKRFQVDAFVVNPNNLGAGNPPNLSTLEFIQDRKLDRGNKWGAWFKNDMELHAGVRMNWNGAMHSEGNIMIGNSTFKAYLISSPKSCVFLPESNSEISVRVYEDGQKLGDNDQPDPATQFFGVIAAAQVNNGSTGGNAEIHTYNGDTYQVPGNFTSGNDWSNEGKPPIGFSSDPIAILTQGIQQARQPDVSNETNRAGVENPVYYKNRFFETETDTQPYVDDSYRADNRWGPKVRYKDIGIPDGQRIGGSISGALTDANFTADEKTSLIRDTTTGGVDLGLDGYWERRAIDSRPFEGGMRLLVGERLELGNPFGWVAPQDRPNGGVQDPSATPLAGDGDWDDLRPEQTNYTGTANALSASPDTSDNEGDSLNPPYKFANPNRAHEARQRRAMRDNLAAVQATAVYHYNVNQGTYPAACLITTAHPGSPATLQQSVNFTQPPTGQRVISRNGNEDIDTRFDFFYGKGTNGWEFAPPPETDLASGGSAIRTALQNLAYFAGDYDEASGLGGAFPPTQEAGRIHPDPVWTMWGNFSNLRRALDSNYADLSPADKTYLHTAGCTLNALAYNISQVQKFDPSNPADNTTLEQDLQKLADIIDELMDGEVTPNEPHSEVLPRERLNTYNYDPDPAADFVPADPNLTANLAQYNPRDYDRVTPDMILSTLKERLIALSGVGSIEQVDPDQYKLYQLAVLVHENFQIRRDRTYGFRPSPAANTWNYNPYMVKFNPRAVIGARGGKTTLWSSACDPNIFDVGTDPTGIAGANIRLNDEPAKRRLLLSRLCGAVIPPGAVHDYPGDYNYPARGIPPTTPSPYLPDGGNFTPNPGVPGYITRVQRSEFADAGNTLNTTYAGEEYKTALVAPKFPALFYIFPEFDHNQTASGINLRYHQPGGSATLNALPAAVQPWAEPYITQVSNPRANYRVVDARLVDSRPTASARISEDYTVGGSQTGVIFNPADSKLPSDVSTFTYKAVQAFPEHPDRLVNLGSTPTAPRATLANWTLPVEPTVVVGAANNKNNDDRSATPARPNLVRVGDYNGNTVGAIPFIDRVMFDGREWLPNRVLDIDLNLLRTRRPPGAPDNWLPASGVVYAFREDAVREDAIARPSNGVRPTATVNSYTNAQEADFPNVQSTDPPLTVADPARGIVAGISTKPVDYVPDPDRRTHGFRLRNGAILARESDAPADREVFGMTFVSDNPAYIMGDFNIHQDGPNGTRLEEFPVLLPNNPDNYSTNTFYDSRNVNPDPKFAKKDSDLWRPTDILADSITILSREFCDGSMIDTFMNAAGPSYFTNGLTTKRRSGSVATEQVYQGRPSADIYDDQASGLFGPGCTQGRGNAGGATSFLNQNRPQNDPATTPQQWNWVRENPSDPINSPVKISRNGNGLIGIYKPDFSTDRTDANLRPLPIVPVEYSSTNASNSQSAGNYFTVAVDGGEDTSRPLQTVPKPGTNVNAILVSGIIPSRENQGYGGMHNFPRVLETWGIFGDSTPLRFAGSFLQLNFSNYATGLYDQDAWEPNNGNLTPSGDEQTDYYYNAPGRLWGYDVALQLAPASPVASRFTTPSNDRNEFYNEPKINDPYIQNLCTALKTNRGFTDAQLRCPT